MMSEKSLVHRISTGSGVQISGIIYRILWDKKEINVIKISRKDDETCKIEK